MIPFYQMGITNLDITISNPAEPKKKTELSFLIDSGATYSVVSAPTLKKLGIKPEEERKFTLANGQRISRQLGIARFEYNNYKGGAPVIFGKKGNSTLIGATALEALGFAINPLKRELIPLPMILG